MTCRGEGVRAGELRSLRRMRGHSGFELQRAHALTEVYEIRPRAPTFLGASVAMVKNTRTDAPPGSRITVAFKLPRRCPSRSLTCPGLEGPHARRVHPADGAGHFCPISLGRCCAQERQRSLADQRANLLVALFDLAHQLLGKVGDLLRDLANVTATVVCGAARASPSRAEWPQ